MKLESLKKSSERRDIAEQLQELQQLRGQVRQAELAVINRELRSQGATKH
jgi:hypothetical protein